MEKAGAAIQNRYDFVMLFDVRNGNPNGDPDAGNAPRIDNETGIGLVSDVCLKRKVRDYVQMVHSNKSPYGIFIQHGTNLNTLIAKAHEETGGMPAFDKNDKKWAATTEKVGKAAAWMCQNFFDVRCFGAVMSTGPNAGQIRGPVQFAFGFSLDPIASHELAITRGAVADNKIKGDKVGADDFKRWEAEQPQDTLRTMGRKSIIPYGLYRLHGFVSAPLAKETGFSEDDLELLWQTLLNMFDHDRSAARGEMAMQKLIVFKHDSVLGNAPAHKLFERVKVTRKDQTKPPRSINDYAINIDREDLPPGISIEEKA